MATITASMFSALDGVVDPGVGNWHFPYFNEEMGKAVDKTHDADVMLFGRVTYDSFAGAWPDREAAGEEDAGMAKRLGDVRKIVASRRRLEFTWRNSEQLRGNLIEVVTALKNDPAIRRVALSGSVSLVRQLLDAGPARRAASVRPPGCRRVGPQAVRGGRARSAPQADLRAAVHHGRGVPRVRAGPEPADGLVRQAKENLPQG
jgi:dihydrofolate reductase